MNQANQDTNLILTTPKTPPNEIPVQMDSIPVKENLVEVPTDEKEETIL